ncbi:MAG TPA: tetratricopeptide repeat protein [Candidatus Polarisedimenticolaceae bacterium]
MRRILPLAVLLVFLSPHVRAGKAVEVRAESFRRLSEGAALVNRGEYGKAVEILRGVTNTALNSYRAWYFLGLALLGDRRPTAAVDALRVALELDPSQLQAHVAFGDAYLQIGDLGEAEAAYHRALKLRPDFPAAYEGLGRLAEARADEAAAVDFYEKAIASNRGYPEAYVSLGDLYLRRGRLEEAVKLLAEGVTVRPDYVPGLNRLALAYARLGLQNEAVATVRRAIELQPWNPDPRAVLGRILLDLGLAGDAAKAFGEALARDPAHPPAREGNAELRRREGDYAGALAELDAILADERTDTSTRVRVEETRAATVAERDRVAAITARLEAGTATAVDFREAATLEASRGRFAEAAELESRAGTQGPDTERLAWYRLRAGRYQEAHELYAVLARSSQDPVAEVNDGVALALLGNDAAAIEAFRRAIVLPGAPDRAWAYLGNALYRSGRREEAVDAYVRYIESGASGETAERVRRVLARIAPSRAPQAPPPPPFVVRPQPAEEGRP